MSNTTNANSSQSTNAIRQELIYALKKAVDALPSDEGTSDDSDAVSEGYQIRQYALKTMSNVAAVNGESTGWNLVNDKVWGLTFKRGDKEFRYSGDKTSALLCLSKLNSEPESDLEMMDGVLYIVRPVKVTQPV